MTAARIACLFTKERLPNCRYFRSSYRGAFRRWTGYLLGGRSSRGRLGLLDSRSPGLLSRRVSTTSLSNRAAYRGLPLSDQPPAHAGRNPRRTLLVVGVQIACRRPPMAVGQRKHRKIPALALKLGTRLLMCCQYNTRITHHLSATVGTAARNRCARCHPRRDSFCNSSRSVRNPDVSRMRAKISALRLRNSAVCFIPCSRARGNGTS